MKQRKQQKKKIPVACLLLCGLLSGCGTHKGPSSGKQAHKFTEWAARSDPMATIRGLGNTQHEFVTLAP